MKKNSRIQAIIAVLFFMLIILAYIYSEIYIEDNIPKPKYESYDQTNRLEKIRKGLEKR